VWCAGACSKYGLQELVCLGGFDNSRQEISWQGYTLELDETKYPWGTLYELEAETVSHACTSSCHSMMCWPPIPVLGMCWRVLAPSCT
jgi:hypothetical protein